MSTTVIVIDKNSDWSPYYPSQVVMSFEDYLRDDVVPGQRKRVINLCTNMEYRSSGYYCSLLAEARRQHVIPAIRTINDLSDVTIEGLLYPEVLKALSKIPSSHKKSLETVVAFGLSDDPKLKEFAQVLFNRIPCPILRVVLTQNSEKWSMKSCEMTSTSSLSDREETHFANALDQYSQKVWSQRKVNKPSRYDLAILVDEKEELPPSNAQALSRFKKAANKMGVDVEMINQGDEHRLAEFDGLFIRTTTAIDHYTYKMARRADELGLMVIDDPVSMLRCTNKIFLADLFKANKVLAPKTIICHEGNEDQIQETIDSLGFPMVIKIPDGSFSRGVIKVKDRKELEVALKELFQESTLILAQEYIYTEYDWRIGILGGEPLFACRYYMVKNHWQIYLHGKKVKSGGFDSVPLDLVPPGIIKSAIKATKWIGNGLYGVDLKELDGKGVVIEVNDNPNIDHGVEDLVMGKDLYDKIILNFISRMSDKIITETQEKKHLK